MSVVEDKVWSMTEALLEGSDTELIDVEYVKEKDWFLRVYIDKPGGVGLEDCEDLSVKLSERLDAEDAVPGEYILEVSSPGLERVLKKPRDFQRERGKMVEVSLYEPVDGEKKTVGTLEGFEGEALILKEHPPIPKEKIAQVRLYIEI